MTENHRDRIPRNKAMLLLGGVVAAFSGCLAAIWAGLGCTELDRKGIHIHLPGFSDKIWRWEDIQQIGIIYRKRRTTKEHSWCNLVVIPKGCDPFVPQVDDGWSYMDRNVPRIHTEDIKHAPLFEKYWGPLDFDGRCINKE